jgi:KDO2-lipid IV(A) lauroyltransferase
MGDLRLGEDWGRAQRLRNDVFYALARLALRFASASPRRALARAGRLLGSLLHAALGAERRRAARRLRLAFGPSPPVGTRQVFEALGEDLADAVALLDAAEPLERTLVLGPGVEAAIREATAPGRGVVWATAHLGPLERMAALVAARGYPVATVARASYDPRFDAIGERLRGGRGVRSIFRGRPGAGAALVRALRAGALVGFPMDLGGRGLEVEPCELLGERSPIPTGPARLAVRTGAAVLVGTPAPRPGGGLQVTIEPVFAASGRDDRARALELTHTIASALDRRVRALPAHWPWMHSALQPSSERCPSGESGPG